MESVIKFNADEKEKMKPYELSEVVLLGARALEAEQKHQEAFDFLKKHKKTLVDKVALMDYEGRLNLRLNKKADALKNYEYLLQLNSANLDTYYKILAVKGVDVKKAVLTSEEQAIAKKTLLDYAEKLPRVNSHLRLALRYLEGADFEELLPRYMRPLLEKGVPSVMNDLRELYTNPEKVKIIEKQLFAYLESMKTELTLHASDEVEQDPTV